MILTGGSGLLAYNWAFYMRREVDIVLGLHKTRAEIKGTEFVFLDLDSTGELSKKVGELRPDVIVNLTALTSVEYCESNPELANHVNVDLAINIAKVCNEKGVKLVHISTDHLFSGEKSNLTEEADVSPVNIYGRTKAKAEEILFRDFPETLIIRTNFFGWGPPHRSSFSDYIINNLRKNRRLNLFCDVFFTPIISVELVKIIHCLIGLDATGIFNVSSNERVSKFEFGLKIAELFKHDKSLIGSCSIRDRSDLIKRPLDMSLSNKKLLEFTGKPVIPLDQQLSSLRSAEKRFACEKH